MLASNEVSTDFLKECVKSEVDGSLFWRERPTDHFPSIRECKRWNSRYAGSRAFNTINNYGYLIGRLSGVSLYSHRVVWALFHSEWPYPFIDHIDGNRINNELSNLRIVDKLINNRNASLRRDNKSGYSGIRVKPSGKYEVNVRFHGKQNYLGSYETIEEALYIRDRAYETYNYSERHGNVSSIS